MARAEIKAVFPYDVKTVWNMVAPDSNDLWRSDLSKIEVLSETRFVEYTKGGYVTTFDITVSTPYGRLEFDIENDNMRGHWTGLFSENESETTVWFTEQVSVKRLWMKPFAGLYLKKQQAAYIKELERALKNR